MAEPVEHIRAWLDQLTAEPSLAEEAGRAVAAMGWQASHGLEVLVSALRDPESPPARRVAATALLGHVRNEVAVEPLVQAVLDDDPAVRWEAAASLCRLADLATPVLVEGLRHYNPEIRKVAVHALGVIGPGAAAAVPELSKLLNDPRPKLRRRVEAALREITGGGTEV